MPADAPDRAAPRPRIRVTHRASGTVLADGPKGWGMTPFEGNVYIGRKWLRTKAFRPNWVPGLCPYKFLYVWMDLRLPGEEPVRFAGWLYWLPNPLLPFIAFRVAVARDHPAIAVEEYEPA
ncbi:MAG: hypothetical protein RRA92_11180, partial [Gemmatimonadota bacterium]|nr:hypothetical protein [Gemmatimonadota bacterium]